MERHIGLGPSGQLDEAHLHTSTTPLCALLHQLDFHQIQCPYSTLRHKWPPLHSMLNARALPCMYHHSKLAFSVKHMPAAGLGVRVLFTSINKVGINRMLLGRG